MGRILPFLEKPDGTRGAIMQATYQALCTHGYSELTIQRIADHFEKSKSLLYHHYDSKDELLLDFLEFMVEEFEERLPTDAEAEMDSHLDAVLDEWVAQSVPAGREEFMKAMVELRAQAAHDERYSEHFARHDEFFQSRLAEDIRTGMAADVFREVDPDRVAALLLSVITGAITQHATADTDLSSVVRDELQTYMELRLLPERC